MGSLEMSGVLVPGLLPPLRGKVPKGRMRGSFRLLNAWGENPSSVSRCARSTFSLKGRREGVRTSGLVRGAAPSAAYRRHLSRFAGADDAKAAGFDHGR